MIRIDVHPSQYPEVVKAGLRAALEERRLPARFLYDSPAQAARWLAYHEAWSPSRTQASLRQRYAEAFDATLADMAPLVYVGLGTGGGTKDAHFLARAHARGRAPAPVLADTSASLVIESMLRVAPTGPLRDPAPVSDLAAIGGSSLASTSTAGPSPGPPPPSELGGLPSSIRGLLIDLEARPPRSVFAEAGAPAVFAAFGMVPNLEAGPFLAWLENLLGPQDRALVSANLHPAPWPEAARAILPQYDNPEARAWYAGALAELGLDRFELRVRGRPLRADGAAWRVEVEAEARAEAELLAFDARVPLSAGEALAAFFSNRFTPAAFEAELDSAGLEILGRWLGEGIEEGIWLVRRST